MIVAGDDVAKLMKEEPTIRFFEHMQLIGSLSVEKSETLIPICHQEEGGQLEEAKFLKRNLTLTPNGISTRDIYKFPPFAPVFSIMDEYHKTIQKTKAERCLAFISGISSLLWEFYNTGISDDDHMFVTQLLRSCYRKLDLPFRGSLPGHKHKDFEDYIPVAVPPIIGVDYSYEDWAEVLYDRCDEKFMMLPPDYGPTVIPPFSYGLEFVAESSKVLNVLEDVGCIRKSLMKMSYHTDIGNRRKFMKFAHGDYVNFFSCTYMSYKPSWFDDLFAVAVRDTPLWQESLAKYI
jgi:hypothetical protein